MQNTPFPVAAEQTDFTRHALKIRICPSDKIRLFGCRCCGAAKRISFEILVAKLHHRGSGRYITLPSFSRTFFFR